MLLTPEFDLEVSLSILSNTKDMEVCSYLCGIWKFQYFVQRVISRRSSENKGSIHEEGCYCFHLFLYLFIFVEGRVSSGFVTVRET